MRNHTRSIGRFAILTVFLVWIILSSSDLNDSETQIINNPLITEDQKLKENKQEITKSNLENPQTAGISSWWNEDFESRIEITITEPNIKQRVSDPVEIYVSFLNETCNRNATRIIEVDGISQIERPSQIYNITLWKNGSQPGDISNFIQTAIITFPVSINFGSTKTLYILIFSVSWIGFHDSS